MQNQAQNAQGIIAIGTPQWVRIDGNPTPTMYVECSNGLYHIAAQAKHGFDLDTGKIYCKECKKIHIVTLDLSGSIKDIDDWSHREHGGTIA